MDGLIVVITILNTSGLLGLTGAGIKFLFDHKRQRDRDRLEAANLGVQTDINLDQARLTGVKGLMEQLDYYQAIIKNLRLEVELLREQNTMLRQIMAQHGIAIPVIEKGGVARKEEFL